MKKRLALFFICALAFALRLYGADKISLWYDEFCTFYKVSVALPETLARLDSGPLAPLYFIITNLWVHLFGLGKLSLRFPSIIFSALSVFYIFKFAKELYGEKTAWFCAILLCFSPYSINYAQDAKMYAMFWCLGIVSFLYFYRFTRSFAVADLAGYIISAVLTVYTMYIGFLFILVQNIFFLAFYRRRAIKKWLLAQLAIALLYIPWWYTFFYGLAHKRGITWIPEAGNYYLHFLRIFETVTGMAMGRVYPAEIFLYLILLFSALTTLKKAPGRSIGLDFKREEALLLLWILVPLAFFFLVDRFIFPVFLVRYVGFIHIPLIVLFARGLSKFRFKLAAYALLALMLAITAGAHLRPYYQQGLKIGIIGKEDWDGMYERIRPRLDKDSLVICANVYDFFLRYYDKEHRIETLDYLIQRPQLKFKRVFIIYREEKDSNVMQAVQSLSGYVLREDYFSDNVGYMSFEAGQ